MEMATIQSRRGGGEGGERDGIEERKGKKRKKKLSDTYRDIGTRQ